MTVLDRILERKREEVAELRRKSDERTLGARAREAGPTRGFARALVSGAATARDRGVQARLAVQGRDPARTPIRRRSRARTRRPVPRRCRCSPIATSSAARLDDLRRARDACALPVLRKDFTIDRIQILEARAAGADAVLLIVAALSDAELRELLACARELGIDALVEVHEAAELERALALDVELVGINNRDLHSFKTDVAVTRALLPRAAGRTVISESGLDSRDVVRELDAAGVQAFLVGEALMREADPGAALRRLRGAP